MIIGTFAVSHWFGSVAALAVILAAIYLLWSYQRMAYGPGARRAPERCPT